MMRWLTGLLVALLMHPCVAEETARNLFMSGKADALRISILKRDGAHWRGVGADTRFRKGDEIKVAFESNFQGCIYIINVTPGGGNPTFCSPTPAPHPSVPDNRVESGRRYELPPGNKRIQFDAEPGVETLLVVMSKGPIERYDRAIRNGGILELPPVSRPTTGGIKLASANRAKDYGLYQKLGVADRTQAVLEASKRRLI